jgi:hypothetical protein
MCGLPVVMSNEKSFKKHFSTVLMVLLLIRKGVNKKHENSFYQTEYGQTEIS